MKNIMTLVFAFTLISCAKVDTKPTNADIFSQIKDDTEWQDDFEKCPADLMPRVKASHDNLNAHMAVCENDLNKCISECKSGNGELCYAGADTLQKQLDKPKLAQTLHIQSCKLGIASGCTNSAAYLMKNQENVTKEQAECAVLTFEKACTWDDPWACTMSGVMYAKGEFVSQNFNEAKRKFRKACSKYGQNDPACQAAMHVEKQIPDTQ